MTCLRCCWLAAGILFLLLPEGLARAQCPSTPFGPAAGCPAPKESVAPEGSRAPPPPSVGPGQVILSDDFATLDPSWGRPGAGKFVAADRLELHPPAGQAIDAVNSRFAYIKFDARVDVVAESGDTAETSAGIMFWAGSGGAYYFLITPAGRFFVTRFAAGKFTTILGAQKTPLLQPGIGVANRIGVITGAGQAILLINGHQVGGVAAPPILPGHCIGLRAASARSSAGDFAFGRFRVRAPVGRTVPVGAMAAPARAAGQVIWHDDFTTPDPAWGHPDALTHIGGGQLVVDVPGNGEEPLINWKYVYGDAHLSVRIARAGPPAPDAVAGLIFWAEDYSSYYLLLIDGAGNLGVFREADGRSTAILDWSANQAIKTADGASNEIDLVLHAGKADIAINGEAIGELPASGPRRGGLVGLYAGATGNPSESFRFSGFSVRALTAKDARGMPAVRPQTPATMPGEILFSDNFATLNPLWGKPTPHRFVRDGHLVLVATKGVQSVTHVFVPPGTPSDVAVDIVPPRQGAALPILTFWGDGIGDGYALVTRPRSFRVWRIDAAGLSYPINWTPIPDQRPDGAPYRIEVAELPGQAIILINGKAVARIPAPAKVAGNYSGLACGSGAGSKPGFRCAFADFVVSRPAPYSPPAAGDTLYTTDFAKPDPAWQITPPASAITDGHLEFGDTTVFVPYAYRGTGLSSMADIRFDVTTKANSDPRFVWRNVTTQVYDAVIFDPDFVNVSTGKGSQTATDLGPMTFNSAWNPGPGQPNRIDLVDLGDRMLVLVNTRLVTQIHVPAAGLGNRLGFSCIPRTSSATAACTVSNLRISVPSREMLAQPVAVPLRIPYTDHFATLNPVWGAPTKRLFVRDGHLVLVVGKHFEGVVGAFAPIGTPTDIAVDVVPPRGNAGHAMLSFWGDGNGDGYNLEARPPSFRVWESNGGKISSPIAWMPIPDPLPPGVPYRLEVAELPAQAIILIDGKAVARIPAPAKVPGDYSGLMCGPGAGSEPEFRCAFADLAVSRPAPYSAPAAGETLYATDFAKPDPAWEVTPPDSAIVRGHLEIHKGFVLVPYSYRGTGLSSTADIRFDLAVKPADASLAFFWLDTAAVEETRVYVDSTDVSFAATGQQKNQPFGPDVGPPWNQGAGASNRVDLLDLGKRILVLINGEIVTQIRAPAAGLGDSLGFQCQAATDQETTTCTISNLRIGVPSREMLAKAARLPPGLLYRDNFSASGPDWDIRPPSFIKDHRLEIRTGPGGFFSGDIPYTGPSARADLTIDAMAENPASETGIVFWENPADGSEYVFTTRDGAFSVIRFQNGKLSTVVNDTPSPYLNGAGVANQLAVRDQGNSAMVLAGGQQLARLPAPPAGFGHQFGLQCYVLDQSSSAACAFSNLVIAEPSAGSSAGSTAAAGSRQSPPVVRPQPLAPGQPIYTDDFRTLSGGWENVGQYASVANGALHIHAPASSQLWFVNGKLDYRSKSPRSDISARVTNHHSNGPGDYAGLVFWARDARNGYEFVVEGGLFAVARLSDGRISMLIDPTPSDALKSAHGGPVTLGVIDAGHQAYFAIDGTVVGHIRAASPNTADRIGFACGSAGLRSNECGFSRLSVTVAPDRSALAPRPGNVIFDDDFAVMAPGWGQPTRHIGFDSVGHRLQVHVAPDREYWGIRSDLHYRGSGTPHVVLSAIMTESDGADPNAAGGLVFWAKDGNNFYELLAGNGDFSVFRRVSGSWRTVIPWTRAAVGFSGAATHTVEITDEGSEAYIGIDGTIVGRIPAPRGDLGDRVGVVCLSAPPSADTCSFSDFRLTVAPSVPGPAAAGSTIFSDNFRSRSKVWGETGENGIRGTGVFQIYPRPGQDKVVLDDAWHARPIPAEDIRARLALPGPAIADTYGGIVFWAKDAADAYEFTVGGGHFDVGQLVKGRFALIKSGDLGADFMDSAMHRLDVIDRGGSATLLVDGESVARIQALEGSTGDGIGLDCGVGSQGGGECAFAGLSVAALSGAAPPPVRP